jgi:hypothetical protein
MAAGRVAGRVEHVVSRQATHFLSLEALLAFIAHLPPGSPPLLQSPYLDPGLYKKLFGLLLLVVGLDMVIGFTDALRQW